MYSKYEMAFRFLGMLGAGILAFQAGFGAEIQKSPPNQDVLSPADKTELAELFRLKKEIGDRVWPGFGQADIPVLLYNDDFEFLIGMPDPPVPWEAVRGDDVEGRIYYRRQRAGAQAFAVRISDRWAGSISTLERMNAGLPFKLPPDFHIALLAHEMFHAFQAALAPERFARAVKVYAVESRYPFKDREFAAAWTAEGAALSKGLQATEAVTAAEAAGEFLKIRDERRAKAGLDADLLAFERELEWLEGLAKYVEVGFYEAAAALPLDASPFRFQPKLPFIQSDYLRLRNGLGAQAGDLRFYLSGLAQARILSRILPDWKDEALTDEAFLEDMIRRSRD